MAITNEVINIGSKADTRGFKKAESAAAKLTKTLKNLAGAFGLAYSTAAVVRFGKESVKAFAADEKAAIRLAKVVDNLGLSFANPQINNFIEKLSLATGVTDDQLRPAFQALITTTGSLTNSQSLLKQAIDVAAGSGENLTTVAQDLANAYVGNAKGLKKYNLGLTKAELAAASFTKIQMLLNKQFAGANQAYLETYAGKMEKFTTAAGEAQEIIGKGLLDALGILGGQGVSDIDAATDSMNKLATATSEVIVGQATALEKLGSTKGGGFLKGIAKFGAAYLSEVLGITASRELGRAAMNPATGASTVDNYNMTKNAKAAAAARAKAERDAKKRAAEILAAQKKNTEELKKQAALKKAGSLFDLDQVQLIAALKGKLSDEDRKRVELQLALLTGNVSEAQKLSYEVAKAAGLTEALARSFASLPAAKNPFEAWDEYLNGLLKKVNAILAGNPVPAVVTPTNVTPSFVGTPFGQAGSSQEAQAIKQLGTPFGQAGGNGSGYIGTPFGQAQPIVVQIDGKTVASAMQDQSLSGNNTTINRMGAL